MFIGDGDVLIMWIMGYDKGMEFSNDTIKKKILPLLKAGGIIRSSLFGSAARGEGNAESDIDLLVEFGRSTGFFAFCRLQRSLEDALGRKIDLVTFRALHPLIKDRVMADAVTIL